MNETQRCPAVYVETGSSAYQTVSDKCRLEAGHDGKHIGWDFSWYEPRA